MPDVALRQNDAVRQLQQKQACDNLIFLEESEEVTVLAFFILTASSRQNIA